MSDILVELEMACVIGIVLGFGLGWMSRGLIERYMKR
jgi:hypothetical protein